MIPTFQSIEQDDAALKDAISAFMSARGYEVETVGENALLGRSAKGRIVGTAYVPEMSSDPMISAKEEIETLRAAGVERNQIIPVVKRSRSGVNRAAIAALGGSPLTAAQYFDWYFRSRRYDDEDDSSVLSDRLRRKVEGFRVTPRAPQPFKRLSALAPDAPAVESGRDLYERLSAGLAEFSGGPRLIVLSGPAGVGKSVLTAELLEGAQRAFNDAKNRDRLGVRPILFEPLELGSGAVTASEIRSFRDLVGGMFGTQITSEVPAKAFAWLHRQGLNSWVLDGLDEFFRRQTNFFETLEDALNAPNSNARVMLSTRDSLFASSDALREFLERRLTAAPDQTEIYELERWDADAKRAYIAAVLEHEQGAAGQPQIDAIAARIEARPDLVELSDLPFYCSRLVHAIRQGDERALKDEFSLLQFTIDAMVDREIVEKKVMRLEEFVSEYQLHELGDEVGADKKKLVEKIDQRGRAELEDMLGLAAFLYRFAEETPADEMDAADWVDGVLPSLIAPSLDEAQAERLELALAHFPLFARGSANAEEEEANVRFVHILVAEYLAATYALNLIQSNPGSHRTWEMALGKRLDWERTVFFRRLAAALKQDGRLRQSAEAVTSAMNSNAAARVRALLAG